MMRPTRYPAATCRKPKFPRYATPGILMNVSALVSVATTEKRIAHQGICWPAMK